MYKRAMRGWGLYKNNRSKERASATTVAANHKGSRLCRYLKQNRVDEPLNTLLYFFPLWIAHADAIWDTDSRMSCPPRAAYIYDGFTQSIAAAADLFERGETAGGGAKLRRAFVELEATLMPRSRSIFSLDSLFFALATLNQANLHNASRLLITHAAGLVALRTQRGAHFTQYHVQGCPVETPPGQTLVLGYQGEHGDHPFPQILNQLQLLAAELKHDDSGMTDLVHRTWSTYHQLTSRASARAVSSRASHREFWNQLFLTHSSQTTPEFISSKPHSWMDAVQPILHYLHRLSSYAKTTGNDDMRMVCLDEITAVYAFSCFSGFEETALSLLETVESKCAMPGTDDTAAMEEWGANVTFELSNHYIHKGDLDNAVKYMSRAFPDKVRAECGALFKIQLQCWIQEQEIGRQVSGCTQCW